MNDLYGENMNNNDEIETAKERMMASYTNGEIPVTDTGRRTPGTDHNGRMTNTDISGEMPDTDTGWQMTGSNPYSKMMSGDPNDKIMFGNPDDKMMSVNPNGRMMPSNPNGRMMPGNPNNRMMTPDDNNPEKTKVSKGIIFLVVICLVIGVFGITIEKIKSRTEPKRVAGDAPVMTQNKKVPKDRKEFFYIDGEEAATTDTSDSTEDMTDDSDTEDITDDGSNTEDMTDDDASTEDGQATGDNTGEDQTTENPFAYIYDQSGKDDAANNSSSDKEDEKTYGKHEVFEDMLDAGEYLSYLVDKGVTGMVDIYISGKIIDHFGEIQTGYYYHNYLANLSETFYWCEVGNNTYRINITITRSDCGYVYRNIVYGEEIPEDRDKAVRLREEVEKIYNETVTPDMSDFEIELALHDRVVSQCKYIGTESAYDIQHSAYGSLVNKEAVCDGYSKGFSLLLTRAGIDNEVIYGIAGGPHAWNQVKIDGVWYMVDATWDDPEYSSKKETAFHQYFNVSDDYLSVNHSWLDDTYHECSTMKDNYFNHYGYVYKGQKDYEKAMKERIAEHGRGVYESVICDSYSIDNAFVRDASGGRFSEYYNDILNDYYFTNVIIK